jgi:heavy metal sensor kinase
MKWGSIRLRLIFWNGVIMALVLIAAGVTLTYSVRAFLSGAVDRDLADRAHGAAARWNRFDPTRMPQGPPNTPSPNTASRRSPPPGASDLERRGFYRRPRFLNREGHSLVPFAEDIPWDDAAALVSAQAGVERYSTLMVEGEALRIFSIPLLRENEIEGVIQVAHPLTEQARLEDGLARTLLMLIPLALLVAGVGGAFLTDRALRPVKRITAEAARIGAQDLSHRLEVTGKDELSELASTFNGMIARLEAAFQQMEQAYEQQRRFTADASHELRTPLTTIKANTSLALCGEPTAAEYREALEAADEAADSMNRIVQDLLLLARSDGGQLGLSLQPVAVRELLSRAATLVRDGESAHVELQPLPADLGVIGDAHHLVRLFVNLLENAVRHTPASGRITLSAQPDPKDPNQLVIRVTDTGEGIPPQHLAHVCERFYRVDAARSHGTRGGTGLGLAICQSIVQAHSGTLSLASEVGRGTTVTVTLPRAELAVSEPRELSATR